MAAAWRRIPPQHHAAFDGVRARGCLEPSGTPVEEQLVVTLPEAPDFAQPGVARATSLALLVEGMRAAAEPSRMSPRGRFFVRLRMSSVFEREWSEAVARLDAVFHRKTPRTAGLCVLCEDRDFPPFDEIVRRHRKARMDLPILVLEQFHLGHGSAFVHGDWERFKYFLPALLVTERELGELRVPVEDALEVAPQVGERWTADEHSALNVFFECLLRRNEARGARFDSLFRITAVASGLDVDLNLLAAVWARPEFVDVLVEMTLWDFLRAQRVAARRVLAHEMVRSAVEEAFFRCTEESRTATLSLLSEWLEALGVEV